MRKKTVRSGFRFMAAGIVCVMAATFFHADLSRLLFLGMDGESRLTFLGFFVGGMCGGCGVLVAAAGLLQTGSEDARIRLFPTILLLISLVFLFFFLVFNSFSVPNPTPLQKGESISI